MSSPNIPKPAPPPPPPPPMTKMASRMRPGATLQARSTGVGMSGYDSLVIPTRGTGVNVPGA